jgi:hypothetical protein
VFGSIDEEKAQTFFEQLLYGAGPNPRLPVYHLRRRLEADLAGESAIRNPGGLCEAEVQNS